MDPELCYAYFWNSFRKFYRVANTLGFTIVNACYPMSVDPFTDGLSSVYRATSLDGVVNFTGTEKAALFTALFDVIPEFRPRIRIFTPRSSLSSLIRQHNGGDDQAYACRGGREFFFIDAKNGCAFPCGYRGTENLGNYPDLAAVARHEAQECRKCDWECFRDPSEMFGPLQDLFMRPARLVSRLVNDRAWLGLWYDDLRYYRACDFFNGRVPPDTAKLGNFSSRKGVRTTHA